MTRAGRAGPDGALGPVLVGLRGCGKSTLAPLVAERLALEPVDADAVLEAREGASVAAIFAERGEPAFRALELRLLLDDLLARPRIVLATGGGAVLHEPVRAELRRRFTAWLHAPLSLLARRLAGDRSRPGLTGDDPAAEVAAVFRAREHLYREVATIAIDTGARPPDAAADAICSAYRAHCRAATGAQV